MFVCFNPTHTEELKALYVLSNNVVFNVNPTDLCFLLHDDAGVLGDGVGLEWCLGGCKDEVCVGLDHTVQVISCRLTAVVHCDLIRRHQVTL